MRLSTLYESMSPDEREALAKAAGMSAGYLYQLAKRWDGRKASIDMMVRLAAAHPRLTIADMAEEFAEPPTAKSAEQGA